MNIESNTEIVERPKVEQPTLAGGTDTVKPKAKRGRKPMSATSASMIVQSKVMAKDAVLLDKAFKVTRDMTESAKETLISHLEQSIAPKG